MYGGEHLSLVASLSAIGDGAIVPVVTVGWPPVASLGGCGRQVFVVPDAIQNPGVVFVKDRLHRDGRVQAHAGGHPQGRGRQGEKLEPVDRRLDIALQQKLIPLELRLRLRLKVAVVPSRLFVLDDLRFQSGTDVAPTGVEPDQDRHDEAKGPHVGCGRLLQGVPVLREGGAGNGIAPSRV